MEISTLHSLFLECGSLSTDTRTLRPGEMFLALRGENFDGNTYALRALEAGASYAVVDSDSEAATVQDGRIIPVEGGTLAVLQSLARYHRDHTLRRDGSRIPVVGLTGTNGKTTTKELVRTVLEVKYDVLYTRGNLNNDIGVPLTVLGMTPETDIAVIEMGASHPDDIVRLVGVCDPDCGLITNVGKAHLEGFGSYDGVKKAKGALYDHVIGNGGTIFINGDDPVLVQMARSRNALLTEEYGIETWGCVVLPPDALHPTLRMLVPEAPGTAQPSEGGDEVVETLLPVETSLVGTYNAPNVLAALCVGMHFGVGLEEGIAAVEGYVPSNNRSMLRRTSRNTLVIDAYNANPTSMKAALDNIAAMAGEKKAVMLGSMGEIGEESLGEHIRIVDRLKEGKDGIDAVYLVGGEFGRALSQSGKPREWGYFPTSEALAAYLDGKGLEGYLILIKGSRSQKMEKVVDVL